MSRMKLLLVAVVLLFGLGASTYQPTQGKADARMEFEWIGWDSSPNWASSFSVVNLGGGGVSRSGQPGVPWLSPDAPWWRLHGDFVHSRLPDLTGWNAFSQLRAQIRNGSLSIEEEVWSDRFQVDLVGWPLFRVFQRDIEWRLDPLAWHDDGWELGFHDGNVEVEFRIYWQSDLVYSWAWSETRADVMGSLSDDYFEVPGWEEPVYECDADAGCWQIDSIPKASGVLWWERTMRMDVVGTPPPPEPEPGTGWLLSGGVAAIWAMNRARRT